MLTRLGFCALPLLAVVACGSSKEVAKEPGVLSPADLPVVTELKSSDFLVLSAQQAWAEITQQADLSETATTGTDDASGTLGTPRTQSANFVFAAPRATNLPAVTAPFVAELYYDAFPAADGAIEGNATIDVAPDASSTKPAGSPQTLSLAPSFAFVQTLSSGDVIRSANQNDLKVTKVGSRNDGQVVRTLAGSVRRSLTSTSGSEVNVDFILTFDGVRVTDSYLQGSLTRRVVSGAVKVLPAALATSTDEAATFVTFTDVQRDSVTQCWCPSQGSATLRYTGAADGLISVGYTFSNGCGQALVQTITTDHISASVRANVQWNSCMLAVKAP